MDWPIVAGGLASGLAGGLCAVQAWRRNIHRWLPAYLSAKPEPFDSSKPLHIYFCFVDHFEPFWAGADLAKGKERVQRWVDLYPKLVDPFRDTEGRPAQHSYFFPAEEYHPSFLNSLRELCDAGYGDVEIHLHHDNDTERNFLESMEQFIERLQGHGFLLNRERRNRFGFIHGNWCLDNSRRDGRWCGLNNEIDLLIKLGCYADFTFPSAPSETQPAKVNCIYYAKDDVKCPKSHDTGRQARVGHIPASDELCLITGPLGFSTSSRKYGLIPRIENGDISGGIPCGDARTQQWFKLGARVLGAPNHVFIKVHTHGTQERLHNSVLGDQAREMYRSLSAMQREGVNLHHVTAYEMWKTVRQLETAVAPAPVQSASRKDLRAPELAHAASGGLPQ